MSERFSSKDFISNYRIEEIVEKSREYALFGVGVIVTLVCGGIMAPVDLFISFYDYDDKKSAMKEATFCNHIKRIKFEDKFFLKGNYIGEVPYLAIGSVAFGLAKGVVGQFTAPFIGAHRQKIRQKPDSFAGFNPNRVSTKIADGISYPAYQIGRLCYKIFGNSR